MNRHTEWAAQPIPNTFASLNYSQSKSASVCWINQNVSHKATHLSCVSASLRSSAGWLWSALVNDQPIRIAFSFEFRLENANVKALPIQLNSTEYIR